STQSTYRSLTLHRTRRASHVAAAPFNLQTLVTGKRAYQKRQYHRFHNSADDVVSRNAISYTANKHRRRQIVEKGRHRPAAGNSHYVGNQGQQRQGNDQGYEPGRYQLAVRIRSQSPHRIDLL